ADPTDPEAYERLLGNERAQCAVTSPPVDAKEYAREGLEPWLKRMAQAIRLLARYAEVVCWQAADLIEGYESYGTPIIRLYENGRPLGTRDYSSPRCRIKIFDFAAA